MASNAPEHPDSDAARTLAERLGAAVGSLHVAIRTRPRAAHAIQSHLERRRFRIETSIDLAARRDACPLLDRYDLLPFGPAGVRWCAEGLSHGLNTRIIAHAAPPYATGGPRHHTIIMIRSDPHRPMSVIHHADALPNRTLGLRVAPTVALPEAWTCRSNHDHAAADLDPSRATPLLTNASPNEVWAWSGDWLHLIVPGAPRPATIDAHLARAHRIREARRAAAATPALSRAAA